MNYQRYVLTVILMTSIAAVTISSPTALAAISTLTSAVATIPPAAYAQGTTDTTANTTDSIDSPPVLTVQRPLTTTVASDTLFVGDIADDTVKIIDVTDGEGHVFIAKNSGQGNSDEGGYRLQSPTGIIVVNDTLLVLTKMQTQGNPERY